MFAFYKKFREFIVEEKDVTTILSIINQHQLYDTFKVGNCGWAEEPTKWFITFSTTDKTYGKIVKEMMKIGTLMVDIGPGGHVDLVFERDS